MNRATSARQLAPHAFVWASCLIAAVACRSASSGPGGTNASTPEPVRTLIDVDSEVFAGVVRGQLDGRDDAYPYHLERFRFDSRPYGTQTGHPEVFAGVQGVDPSLSFPRSVESEAEITYVTDTRRRILRANGVQEGAQISYPQCAGAGVPIPPPPRGAAARRAKPQDVHAGCPRNAEYYLNVGLPIRGQPPGLQNFRDTRGDRVNLKGDVWTVLVEQNSLGPDGWRKSTYAWLFKRDRGVLKREHTILVGVVE
ncbi:MAG TPA: hypothetical protein VGO75_11115 [Gemmatimonadaceae bacterium]|nr:hypothetical protein [Gemmatimonadaceae bacterium]